MSKQNKRALNKNEKEKEKLTDHSSKDEASSLSEEPDVKRAIEITVHSIENISSLKIADKEITEVIIRIDHADVLLGESSPVNISEIIEEDAFVNVNHTVIFEISINKKNSREAAVSTPILITAVEKFNRDNDDELVSRVDASGDFGNKEKGKRSSALKSKSGKGDKSPIVLGICNFDLTPLLLGENTIKENIRLEEVGSHNVQESETVVLENSPRLNVSAKLLDEDNIFPEEMDVNFLSITIESIYNLPSNFTENMNYKANTVVYIENEVTDDIIFDGGTKTSLPDIEKVKFWQTLAHLEGRSKLSKYKLNKDVTKNEFKDQFDAKIYESEPRVQWNSLRRSLILNSGCEFMTNTIKKYKYWPFFFIANPETGQNDIGKQKSKESTVTPILFQCYADVSELLYPGTTRTRTIAQLHTFNIPAMAERTGLSKSAFEKYDSKESIKEKEPKNKGKPSTKGSSSLPTTAGGGAEPESVPSVPLQSDNGQPVFAIIEFELHRPLQPARTLEDLSDCIDKMISKYVLPPDPYTTDLAEEHYSNCVKKLVDTLCRAYQDFLENRSIPETSEQKLHKISSLVESLDPKIESSIKSTFCGETMKKNKKKDCRYPYIKDEISCFTQYLYESGLFLEVRSSLKNKIIMLLDQKFKIQMHTLEKKECQNFVATTYIYLVEEMHKTLNKVVEGQQAGELSSSSISPAASFFAEESYVLGYVDDAKEEYLNIIANDKKNPDTWIEYAIFLLRIKDVDRAIACCREAIALDKRHKIALILYGLILSEKEKYRDAEIFLETVTRLYPRFAEGWAILNLFYLRTENFPGADVVIQIGEKCIKDENPDIIITMHSLKREPLIWSASNYPKDRIYLSTAIFLIKLSCLDFAGIALAQELSQFGRTRHFLYYISVQHYIDNRYEDAMCHLKEAVAVYGMEYSVASLMGHCHLAEGNFEEAIYHYEFANSSFHRPEDLHLVQLKLGYLYLRTEQYEAAKKIFLIVCKNSPTFRSWLGVGIASYHLNDMKNSEKSLTEANSLNMSNAEVWGYLCLVNMSMQRYDEFLQCYRQVVKNNLTDVKLWAMLKELMKSLGYMAPVLSIDSEGSLINESAENIPSEKDEL